MHTQFKPENCELTIDLGAFSQLRDLPQASLFQKVKSEMLKRKERMALRKKPIQYQKLQLSLQQKLKQRSFNREVQRDQIIMLEKCKNYFQLRRPQGHTLTPKYNHSQTRRPLSSCCNTMYNKQNFLIQIQGVMKECMNEEREIKQDMQLFAFYCRMMDRRLQGIRNTIEKKQRMI